MSDTPIRKYFYGTGRRKCSVARVRLYPDGTGKVIINDKDQNAGEPLFIDPLKLVGKFGNTDLSVKVEGGGTHGQLEAIRHGVARALVALDESLRTTLKKAGYLTRDPRERERKKYGLNSARRAPQFSKR